MIKMKVFYSWTIDNEYYNDIKKLIERIIEDVAAEENVNIEVVTAIRDTDAAKSIAESVRNRIKEADIFIGDLSPFHRTYKKNFFWKQKPDRLIQNPNVIFEYGFAESILGEDRCIIFSDERYEHKDDKKFKRTFDIAGNNIFSLKTNNQQEFSECLKNKIKRIVRDNPRKMVLVSELELNHDRRIVGNIYRMGLDNIFKLSEMAVQELRYNFKQLGNPIDELVLYMEDDKNILFDNSIEKKRAILRDNLKKFREVLCLNFSPSTNIEWAEVYKPHHHSLYGEAYKEAEKVFFEKMEQCRDSFLDFRDSYKNFQHSARVYL